MAVKRQLGIEAWAPAEGVILESYRYAPGPASESGKHSHEDYQFCLSLDFPGEYRYRGERYPVPVGSLSVIHPGEAHSAKDPHDRETPVTYRLMYVGPELLARAASEISGRGGAGTPFFPDPVILDVDLAKSFLELHLASEGAASRLEQDARLLDVLTRFVERYANGQISSGPDGRERRAVGLVKEYLEDNLAENVSLAEISRLATLSPYHLSRVFKEEVGLPPHAYQTQARITRARDMILRGWPVSRVAQETGFSDQSHLTRHFKKLVGVPPGSYARTGRTRGNDAKNSKNVQ